MLTRPQPYEAVTHEAKAEAEAKTREAEAKTHEAEARFFSLKAEAKFEAKFIRQRGLKNRKICNDSLVKTWWHIQNVRNWVNYRTKSQLNNSKFKLNHVWLNYTFLNIRHYGHKCKH